MKIIKVKPCTRMSFEGLKFLSGEWNDPHKFTIKFFCRLIAIEEAKDPNTACALELADTELQDLLTIIIRGRIPPTH